MNLKGSTFIWPVIIAALLPLPTLASEWQRVDKWPGVQYRTVSDSSGEMVPYATTTGLAPAETYFTDIGGWLSSGIYSNQYGAKSNGPLTMRNYADGYTVDQMWLYAEKAADNGGSGLAFGGRVDFVWGADGPDTQCFGDGGWDGDWFTSNDDNYGSAIPQLYAETAYNDLRVKVGHFYTIIGYEVVPAPSNFFYSHSYALAIEPFTHMGVLAEYPVGDRFTFYGGWTNGWDNGWINPTNASTFLGGVSMDVSDSLTITYATSFGDLWDYQVVEGLANSKTTTYLHSLVFNWQINCRLNYVLQSDFRTDLEEGGGGVPSTLRYYGVNQYLFYTLNDQWAAGTRLEWFRGESGSRLDGGVETYNIMEITVGVNYKPTERIIFRPEVRWDFGDADPRDVAYWFDNDTRSSQFSGGFDCIVTF